MRLISDRIHFKYRSIVVRFHSSSQKSICNYQISYITAQTFDVSKIFF